MRPTLLLSLAVAPLLSVTLAAPYTLDTRASCPTSPCAGYIAIIEYCEDLNINVENVGETVGALAIECVCGSSGAEGIGEGDGATDEGFLYVNQCYQCEGVTGLLTGDTLTLLTNWEVTCNTWENAGMQQALTCWNEDENCDPYIQFEKRARI
jgi:hypothetical protein